MEQPKHSPENKESNSKDFVKGTLPILAPWTIGKHFGFDKNDQRQIQRTLSMNMSLVSFIGSIVCLLIGVFFLICLLLGIWDPTKTNNYTRLGAFSMVLGNLAAGILLAIGLFTRKNHPVITLVGDILFHLALTSTLTFFFLADLKNGDLSQTDSVTTAVGLLFVLAICQPGLQKEMLAVNVSTALIYIGLVIYGGIVYNLRVIDQYIIFILAYLVACYFIYNSYYFVEAQRHYIEVRNADLLKRSTHDSLTGARNRAGLRLYLDERLPTWKTRGEDLLVIMLDIDDFKYYNDIYGHLKGDEVLIKIVEAIDNCPDIHHIRIFRYGGEEFILIRSRTDEKEAKQILEAARRTVESLRFPAPTDVSVSPYLTISLGGALWSITEDYEFHNQIKDADDALYEAKRSGKNRFVLRTKLIEKPVEEPVVEEEAKPQAEEAKEEKPKPKKASKPKKEAKVEKPVENPQ